ncbi:5'-methylthioadenosine phosphorylase [Marinobacter sp. ANT_B65]|nr:5'-methylthioadenosine phosphorylase [Marinobacter sp. ANT_B65]
MYQLLARTLLTALLLSTAMVSHAQQSNNNFYRAEFVILERIVDPGAVNERMFNRKVEPPVDTSKDLYRVTGDGNVISSFKLASPNQLHLGSAANRLERSGRYRVLMSAGWYESFPPNYKGQPLRIEIGDWLKQAGQREVEGYITIDRRRYLHVTAHLNHWQEGKVDTTGVIEGDSAGETIDSSTVTELAVNPDIPPELLTWIRETRRMRSEEIHFLDSPTIGVLVFFRKIATN